MKKSVVYFSIVFLFLVSHVFSQSASIERQVNLSYQIIRISEKADERVVIINNSGRPDAFQIYIHLEEYGYAANKNPFAFASSEKIMEDENWRFICTTPELYDGGMHKTAETDNTSVVYAADYIAIRSKSGEKYSFKFKTKSDDLYITVLPYDESNSDWWFT